MLLLSLFDAEAIRRMEKAREKRARDKELQTKIAFRNYEKAPAIKHTKPVEFKFTTDEVKKNRSVYLKKTNEWSKTTRPEVFQSEYDLLPSSEQKKFQRPNYPSATHPVAALDMTNKGKGVPPMEIHKSTVPKAPSFKYTNERQRERDQRQKATAFNEYIAKQKKIYQDKMEKERFHNYAMHSARRVEAFKNRKTKEKHDDLITKYGQYAEYNNQNNLSLQYMSKLNATKTQYASQQGFDLSSIRGYGSRNSFSYGSVDNSITSELMDYYDD